MKKIVFLAMFIGFSLASVQCSKSIEERIIERERTNTILSGVTTPATAIGSIGDYYIDLSNVNLYGPKTTEGWGSPISLRGLQGEKGTNGQNAPVPHIDNDGYWYIGDKKTTVKAQGNNGITPTVSIDNDGYWVINNVKTNIKAKGEKGDNGQNGITPTITIDSDGYWVINNVKTNIKAKGEKGDNGQNGTTPTITIDNDGYWVINGVKSNTKAKGEKGDNGQNGITPTITIDNDGHWVINGVKSNTKAKGEKGDNGQNGITPTITIDNDGYWVINGVKSNTKAKGEKGDNGQNGIDAPKPNIKDGFWYIGNQNTNIKAQGIQGERGLPGKDGSKIYAGQGIPTSEGVEGDYYIDTEAKIFYGPKTNIGWPSTGISLTSQHVNMTDYELSPAGKTLLKWKNDKTRFIDMNTDPKLKDVEIIADNAFNAEINSLAYELRAFIIGDKVKEIGKAFYLCTKLTSVEVSNENIRREITKIKPQTFVNCTHLQNVDIPSSVTTIETRAFTGCDRLTTVILPENVSNIAPSAFMKCKNLHTVIIHNPNAFTISNNAFNQTLLRNIYVPSGKIEAYKTSNTKYRDLIK